jgi:DNA-binding PadR family transcriptional regulator
MIKSIIPEMFEPFFKENQKRSRLFKKGDLKYVILDIVKDNPSHGYDITAILEERFHGLYSPSAGSIYPILQSLENLKFVTSCRKDGKNIYTVTHEGKDFLIEQKETTDNIKKRLQSLWGSPDKNFLKDVRIVLNYSSEIRRIIGRMAVGKDISKIPRIKEILAKAVIDIKAISEEDQ